MAVSSPYMSAAAAAHTQAPTLDLNPDLITRDNLLASLTNPREKAMLARMPELLEMFCTISAETIRLRKEFDRLTSQLYRPIKPRRSREATRATVSFTRQQYPTETWAQIARRCSISRAYCIQLHSEAVYLTSFTNGPVDRPVNRQIGLQYATDQAPTQHEGDTPHATR